MTKKKDYLLRWVKHTPNDEQGNCRILEFGTVMCADYERALRLEDLIRDYIGLKEFNESDYAEILPTGDNVEFHYFDVEDDDEDEEECYT